MNGLWLILIVVKLVIYFVNKSSDTGTTYRYTGPVTPLPQPPRPDYILEAIKALAVSEMEPEEVKEMLLDLNVPDTEADEVIAIAQKVCAAWHERQQETDIATGMEPVEVQQYIDGALTYPVLRSSTTAGQYTDAFKMLFGKASYEDGSHDEFIYFMSTYSSFLQPVKSNDRVQVFQMSFGGFGGKFSPARLRTVKANDRIINSFPYLATKSVMPLTTNEVIEWESATGIISEAEIRATRKDNTELSFFATDYAINRQRYLNDAEVNIRISAFAYDVYEFNPNAYLRSLNVGEPPKVPDLIATEKPGIYEFTARVVKMKEVSISQNSTAYILTLKMFENTDRQIYNIIDVFVNAENIVSGEMQQNIVVKGTLWLQGELVN